MALVTALGRWARTGKITKLLPISVMTVFKSFINGAWLDSKSGKTAPNVNPANITETIGTIQLASREEARRAVEAAYNSFRAWKATPAPARGKIVAKAARLMEDRKTEL